MPELTELVGVKPDLIRSHFEDLGGDFLLSLSQRVDLDKYAKKLASRARILAHVEGWKVVSLCAFYLSNNECATFVSHLGVAKSHQGRGLSRQLIDCLYEPRFAPNSCKSTTVSLEVDLCNTLAIEVYSRLGFFIDKPAEVSGEGVLRMTRRRT